MGTRTSKYLAWAGSLALAAAATAAEPPAKKKGAVLAQAGDVTITADELDAQLAGQLFGLRNQEYQMKEQKVLELVGEALLAKEAKAKGVTPEQLEKTEIDDKVQVTEADKDEFYQRVKARAGNRPEAEVKAQIEPQIRQQKRAQREQEYYTDLRNKAGFKMFLDPPRAQVEAGDDPSKGPKDAPITIVEFSDFQCPFCSRVNPTLKKVQETYSGKIRIVFRDFPLQMHREAPKAAEAATCAAEQNKFWEMHDRLFENQSKLQVADLKEHAAAIGLSKEAFDACLDSGRHGDEWKKDMDDGQRYGVNGTPAFFINGRLLSGAQPYEAFSRIIDDELSRASSKPAAKAPASTGSKSQ